MSKLLIKVLCLISYTLIMAWFLVHFLALPIALSSCSPNRLLILSLFAIGFASSGLLLILRHWNYPKDWPS
jgi:hypothetical protein